MSGFIDLIESLLKKNLFEQANTLLASQIKNYLLTHTDSEVSALLQIIDSNFKRIDSLNISVNREFNSNKQEKISEIINTIRNVLSKLPKTCMEKFDSKFPGDLYFDSSKLNASITGENNLLLQGINSSVIIINIQNGNIINQPKNREYFKDARDGTEYEIKDFDGTIWMLENFRFKESLGNGIYKNSSNDSKTEYYYTWKKSKEFCPEGWKLPSIREWNDLKDIFNSLEELIKALKIEFCGHINEHGQFDYFNERAYFWTDKIVDNSKAFHSFFIKSYKKMEIQEYYQNFAYSIRFVKN